MGDGAGAHGAGLERDIEIAAIEAAGAADGKRGADGEEFGVGGGVGELAHAVALGGEDAVAFDDDGADRASPAAAASAARARAWSMGVGMARCLSHPEWCGRR